MKATQATIKTEISLEGIGLHTGRPSRITFRPAPANTGIRFFRTDLPGTPMVPARLDFVVATVRGTNLGLGEAQVHTVEHVLSACTGAGLDNVVILVSAGEPPIMDGSALPFVKAILKAGIEHYPDASKRRLHISGEIRYRQGKAEYRAVPAKNLEIQATLIHDHPLMPEMSLELVIDQESYLRELAPARTFCFEHEVEALRSQGLAQGGSLDNAIVIGKDRYHTAEGGLRFPDEFVRHKMLDLIGDLSLIGRSLFNMRVEAECLGHANNIAFARLLGESAIQMRGKTPQETS